VVSVRAALEGGLDQVYRISAPSVVSEVIDGEAIIMDMRSGFYYSADGIGAQLWEAMSAGASLGQLEGWAQTHFDDDGMVDAIRSFTRQLVDNGLVTAEEGSGPPTIVLPVPAQACTRPVLAVHGDMQDLIMLDPIHDVAEVGWPVRKADLDAPGTAAGGS
jgi:hypothetical protein